MKIKFLILLFFGTIVLVAQDKIPILPNTVVTPKTIRYECIENAKTFPQLEVCRANIENLREDAEEYNSRVKRFCDSLIKFDLKLRKKAFQKKLSWPDYEELKEEIISSLTECNENKGDYYTPYRARIREYKKSMNLIKIQKKAIVDQIGF